MASIFPRLPERPGLPFSDLTPDVLEHQVEALITRADTILLTHPEATQQNYDAWRANLVAEEARWLTLVQ
jgi:hypothetical protein